MTNWLNEVEIPTEASKIGNSEVKTEQDSLNVPITLRCSKNHKAMIEQSKNLINSDIKPPAKKVKDADIWRAALEFYYNEYTLKNM